MFSFSPLLPLEELVAGSSLVVVGAAVEALSESNERLPRGTYFIPRDRHSINDVYNLMGDGIFCRAFRMSLDSFW